MRSILLILACCMAFLPLRAQWTADTETNTTVATSATGDMQSVGTSDGRTWVAFWHDLPAPKYYEMRLQLLDQSGNRVFGEEGMVVDDQVPMSSFTTTWSITVDRQDNVYIGFNGTDGGNPVIVHKIAPDGTQLWGNAGINPGTGFDVKVLPLSNGEVVIGWLPASKGLLQKVSADGVAQWATPVTIEPLVSTHRTSAGEMAELSNGDFMVILHDRGGFSPSSLPYAQRYDGLGAAAWTSPVALTTTYFTSFNRRYALYQDVDTLYFGYAGAQGIQPHGFLQRIDPDGTLPWGADGSDFSIQTTSFERDVQIAYTPGSDVVWAICEYSDPSQSQVGEYVQKFDKKTGERLLGNLGKAVFPIGDVYISHQGKLQLVNDRPVFLVSNGNSNGVFAKDLLVVYLDENGGFAWPEHTRQASNNPSGVKSRIQLNASFEGRVVAAWAEDRPDSAAIRPYAQRIDIDIACVPPTAGFGYTVSDLSATFTNIAIGVDSVAWDFGDGTTGIGADIIHVYTLEGNYAVCEYVFNECGVDTFCRNLVLMTNAAISLEQNYHLNLSPNPSLDHSILSIDMPAPANLTYRLFSSSGRNLFDRSVFLSAGEQSVFMDTKNLPAGNYFLVVTVNGKSATLPMVR